MIPIPWNASSLGSPLLDQYMQQQLNELPSVARSTYLGQVPGDTPVAPNPNLLALEAESMTARWLLDAEADGKIAAASSPSPALDNVLRVRLGFRQEKKVPTPAGLQCRTHTAPVHVMPDKGDPFAFTSDVTVTALDGPQPKVSIAFPATEGTTIVTQLDGLDSR